MPGQNPADSLPIVICHIIPIYKSDNIILNPFPISIPFAAERHSSWGQKYIE
jgi:hypothetical protein